MRSRGNKNKKLTFEQRLCLFGYILIPLFFVILYFLMTETYEDIYQGSADAESSVGKIVHMIYNYLPRLGEFYQRIAVHFMTPQLSFGPDMLFRLITAGIATGTIYLSAIFALGRKLKLQYKDTLITLGILIILMISTFSEAFTYRFSYANNYAVGLFVAIAFLLPFRISIKNQKWWMLVVAAILGFCFGISTEIAPIAFLVIIGVWAFVQFIRKKVAIADLWGKYRIQTILVLGLVAGLAFFFLSGALNRRTGSGYAEVYDYVSPFGIFKTPLATGHALLRHVWYNLRYIFFAIPLMFMYVFVEKAVFKKNRENIFWQIMSICFCILFVGATCVIAVHDDLYPRFMIPVFFAILCSTMIFIDDVIKVSKAETKTLKKATIATVAVGGVLVIDMTSAFAVYNVQVSDKLYAIHYVPGKELVMDPVVEDYYMRPSLVFRLKQLAPFDWGPAGSYTKFGV